MKEHLAKDEAITITFAHPTDKSWIIPHSIGHSNLNIKNNEPNQICMKVTLTTLTKVAKDKTGTKAVFCTNSSNLPACLLFRKDLEALAVGADGLHPMLKNPTAAKLAYVLMAEARDGDDNTSSIILDSPQFAKIARRPITAEITFPINRKFHFNLRW